MEVEGGRREGEAGGQGSRGGRWPQFLLQQQAKDAELAARRPSQVEFQSGQHRVWPKLCCVQIFVSHFPGCGAKWHTQLALFSGAPDDRQAWRQQANQRWAGGRVGLVGCLRCTRCWSCAFQSVCVCSAGDPRRPGFPGFGGDFNPWGISLSTWPVGFVLFYY